MNSETSAFDALYVGRDFAVWERAPVHPKDGTTGRIHAVTRLLTPGNGCLWCNNLIDPTELAIEMQPDYERAQARYVDQIPAPGVIALNSVPTSRDPRVGRPGQPRQWRWIDAGADSREQHT